MDAISPSEFLTISKKFLHIYESYCVPICEKYQLKQNELDILLFIGNNPEFNTARDVCEIRKIKKGIASVMIENLVERGYLRREADPKDRRIQRLILTEPCKPVVEDGRRRQKDFFDAVHSGLTPEELLTYQKLSDKIRLQIIIMEGVLE